MCQSKGNEWNEAGKWMNEYKLKISRVSADDTVDQNEFSISAVVGVDDDDAHRIRTSNKTLSVNCAVWFGYVSVYLLG